ncbi:tRNA lysidine(34) synthetase TilS [Mycoplasma bradburyae]|uniref:tRNA(Ile)-lysidine synthase n=1 Tax=Mycoplasma bradburyae TaxID=2963128 RepID=A0AAW6HRE0_9MOLU|nr:tRNA lysidine(34) synthetase TilS [Mycoplasma bradburyae]MDC4183153.1 tRNA lysidine(34) synthetase TilS [Mycoplasma bradburyae]
MNTTDKKQYLIGVSGGPDSMYLLDQYNEQIKVVCHVNYNKRQSALRDQEIVQNYCKNNNLILELLTVDKNYNYQKNFQTQARILRYDFFLEVAKKYNLQKCLIAHQKDDFLESALMQYDKNKKLLFYGLHKESNYKDLRIIRPILDFWKDDIQNYLDENKIPYGIDETNLLPIYQRNKVRINLSKLTNNKKQEQLDFFNKLNKQNKYRFDEVNNFIANWDHNYKQLIESTNYYEIIYYWLSKNDIKYTKAKADGILEFLQKKNNKKYRLKINTYLIKKNGIVEIIKA